MSYSNSLYYGDNLNVLRTLSKKDPFIDLIYIDPPFNSKRNYNLLYTNLIKSEENGQKTTALKEAFKDTWSNVEISDQLDEIRIIGELKVYNFLQNNRVLFTDAQMSYLTMMAVRIIYMYRVLKETGTFYLHCDPTMSHYLKILCDMIFGGKNFRNEIVWHYPSMSRNQADFPRKHDIIFRYSKDKEHLFNWKEILVPYATGTLERSKYGSAGFARKKGKTNYLTKKGKIPDTVWNIPHIKSKKEKLGYPTQKPEKLLDRIIRASSNSGDVVADFFCGCGTTVTVAEKLKRKWLGVDISHLAIGLIEEKRLKPLKSQYEIKGFPSDISGAEKLAKENHFEFEQWVVEYKLQGHQTKKTGDGGFDGHLIMDYLGKKLQVLIEVKSGSCGVKNLREFQNVIEKQNSDMGFFVCFKKYVTSGMQKECDIASSIKLIESDGRIRPDFRNLRKLNIMTVEELLEDKFEEFKELIVNKTY